MSTATCPKSMEYGPCGGVRFDGRCEVAEHRCVFLDGPTVRWAGLDHDTGRMPEAGARTAAAQDTLALLAARPIVVADFPAAALSVASLDACADILAGSVDVVLAGDHGAARVQYPPAYRAHLIARPGLKVWSGVNMRDRNRVALEGEFAALAVEQVAGVHCVTGNHTDLGHRPDAAPVFDLDSTEAAALARSFGHVVSVAESPVAPPTRERPHRLDEKAAAGADLCFVNHCGGPGPVAAFIDRVEASVRFIPCVPVIVDRASADLMRSFTSLVMPEGLLDAVESAADPRAEGIARAVALCEGFLEIPGVVGVDLSGGAVGGEERFAEALAEIGQRLGLRQHLSA